MDIATVLLAYTSIVLTIIGGILTFMLAHFIPLKTKVETMWRDLYNGAGKGHIEESEHERESMREMLETAQDQHEEHGEVLEDVVTYLSDLGEHIEEENGGDPPHIHEDHYVDRGDAGESAPFTRRGD